MKDRFLLLAGLASLFLGLLGLVTVGNFGYPMMAGTSDPMASVGSSAMSANDPFMGVGDPGQPYDLRFIDAMTMHHEGAIMSTLMITASTRPELRDLARRIQTNQQGQVEQMQAWRKAWYPGAKAPDMSMSPMNDMMGSGMMGSMMGSGMMQNQGTTDRTFLKMMIPHHQLAVDMAQDALKNAQHPELKTLAQQIVSGQSAEIVEMEGYLRNWYGEASTRDLAPSMNQMMQRIMGP